MVTLMDINVNKDGRAQGHMVSKVRMPYTINMFIMHTVMENKNMVLQGSVGRGLLQQLKFWHQQFQTFHLHIVGTTVTNTKSKNTSRTAQLNLTLSSSCNNSVLYGMLKDVQM